MILFNTGFFLTGRTPLPLKGTAGAIYSCAFYSSRCPLWLQRKTRILRETHRTPKLLSRWEKVRPEVKENPQKWQERRCSGSISSEGQANTWPADGARVPLSPGGNSTFRAGSSQIIASLHKNLSSEFTNTLKVHCRWKHKNLITYHFLCTLLEV